MSIIIPFNILELDADSFVKALTPAVTSEEFFRAIGDKLHFITNHIERRGCKPDEAVHLFFLQSITIAILVTIDPSFKHHTPEKERKAQAFFEARSSEIEELARRCFEQFVMAHLPVENDTVN